MRPSKSHSGRRALWLVMLTALTLVGCGTTHTQSNRSTRTTTVGVNPKASPTPGGTVVVNDTPNVVAVAPPSSLRGASRKMFREGEEVVGQAGCLGCHMIGADGNNGPGPELTQIGSRLSRVEITQAVLHARAPMPSFSGLPKPKLNALTAFLAGLR